MTRGPPSGQGKDTKAGDNLILDFQFLELSENKSLPLRPPSLGCWLQPYNVHGTAQEMLEPSQLDKVEDSPIYPEQVRESQELPCRAGEVAQWWRAVSHSQEGQKFASQHQYNKPAPCKCLELQLPMASSNFCTSQAHTLTPMHVHTHIHI